MTTQTITHSTTLVLEECCHCGVPFGLSETHYTQLLRTHETFWCPSGHQQRFVSKTNEEFLKKQVENLRDDLAVWRKRTAETDRRLSAQKGQVTRLKNKAVHGVCPVTNCTRSFQNYARHMQDIHPNYKGSGATE